MIGNLTNEYAAVVAELPELTPLQGCDNITGARFFGLQAIVGKDSVPGTLGIVFPTEAQLSSEYLRENNLYRDALLNRDPEKKGYFEANGRVRAVKFRGHRSDCFWMPLASLSYATDSDPEDGWGLGEGSSFQEINGHEICRKYIPKGKGKGNGGGAHAPKREPRVSKKFFPEHLDTTNYFRNLHLIGEGAIGIVTQKLHGTSVRIGRVPVPQKLGLLARIAKRLGVPVRENEYELIAGSRRVIKDAKANDGGFYDTDIYTETAQAIGDKIPEGFVVYGELIGWTAGGQAIQAGYTYRIPKGYMNLYVYRVAFVNPQGILVDLSWEATKTWCAERGLKHVPEISTGPIDPAGIEFYMDWNLTGLFPSVVVPLEPDNPCDEGVCIRIDGLHPAIFKAKSPAFLRHETEQLDKGDIDMETAN